MFFVKYEHEMCYNDEGEALDNVAFEYFKMTRDKMTMLMKHLFRIYLTLCYASPSGVLVFSLICWSVWIP